MGYYSNVSIAMKTKNLAEMYLKAPSEEIKNFLESASVYHTRKDKSEAVIKWYSVKWNDNFSEIAYINAFLDNLDETGQPFYFIYVGEEPGDIEEQYSEAAHPDDNLHTSLYTQTEIVTSSETNDIFSLKEFSPDSLTDPSVPQSADC